MSVAPSPPTLPAPPGDPSLVAVACVDAVKVHGRGDAAVRALDGITISFQRSRFTAVMGPSGSGKSTLLHCLAGLDPLTSGRVLLGDTDITAMRERALTQLRRSRVGFVFQSFNLVPTLSALDNITLPLRIAGRRPDAEWLDRVIDTMGLRDRLSHRPGELSGGQQQRVAAARALVSRPEIIFADEPSGNLDSRSGAELLAFLRRAVDEFGQTILIVTHDVNAASLADRVIFLADGRVVEDLAHSSVDDILSVLTRFGG